ncbi:MAG: hypothetical protein JO033_15055 [Acidobacteriaceae bacterium]|nr:hypothetical protein [Acidobacteriaceae bacterium]MBV9501387.1 hypothetical protein [Acidobacteriaceae bacterium]
MSRRCGVALACLVSLFATSLFADDVTLWREYGLVRTSTEKRGRTTLTTYEMKDLTGALAAWEMLRSPKGRTCDLAPFCTVDGTRTVITDANVVLVFDGAKPPKAQVETALNALPNKRATSLPAILSFLPKEGLVPDSARYILGPASLAAFAPDLASANPGFAEGAEAQVAEYHLDPGKPPLHLALFYYATPEQARLHAIDFKLISGAHVKRSDVLLAVVYGAATDQEADTLLSRVQYEAKITWNDVPPPSPIKPLYALLLNILYLSIILSGICLAAGLIYAGMRIYRRRYGTLEADEAMTTLRLTGE